MAIHWVLDDEPSLLALYTTIDTAARLRQTCTAFALNAALLARRPSPRVQSRSGGTVARTLKDRPCDFPTEIDDKGRWRLQKHTRFNVHVVFACNLQFVAEGPQRSIVLEHHDHVCTDMGSRPDLLVKLRVELVTGDLVPVPSFVPGAKVIVGEGGTTAPDDAGGGGKQGGVFQVACAVETLSSSIYVLDRMLRDRAFLATLGLTTPVAPTPRTLHDNAKTLARIAGLDEAIKADESRKGMAGVNGKPSAHLRLLVTAELSTPTGVTRHTALSMETHTHPFLVVSRVETTRMRETRELSDATRKEERKLEKKEVATQRAEKKEAAKRATHKVVREEGE